MTLLFFDSMQDGNLVPSAEWSAPWASVQTGRDSQAGGASRITSGGTNTMILSSSAATCVLGCGLKVSTGLGGGNNSILFQDSAFTSQIAITVNSSGFIEARRTSATGTLLGTSSGHSAIVLATYFHISVKVVLNSSSAGSVIVQLNGVTVLTITGTTTSSLTSNVFRIQFATSGSVPMDVDDVYVCDTVDATATQGRTNNDFLGDLRVQAMFPTTAGDSAQWTPSTSTNVSCVDEQPPNTTDYVSDSTSGHRDLYNVTDLSGTVVTVYGVREKLYMSKSDSGSITVKPTIKETGGTVTSDTAQGPAVGSFGAISGVAKYVRPSDSAVWTTSDVNALQVGQEVA